MANLKHVDVRSLPRFKFIDAESHEPRLAEYDPETLFVRRVIQAPAPSEYDRAPTFILQDATTFEVALSRNMGVPCELPVPKTLEVLNGERLVVAMLRAQMSDLGADLVFEHVLVLEGRAQAERIRAELKQLGLDVSETIEGREPTGPSALEIRLRSKAAYPLVRKDIEKMRRLALQCGADYDGFGALPI